MVGGTDIGLEKRRKRNPISIDAAESRYWRSCGLQAVCGSQPDLQRIGNTVRNAGQYSAVRSKQRVYKKRWTFRRLSYFQAVRTGTDCGRSPENLTNL